MSDRGESPNRGEREFEVGKDEAWFANIKATYDDQRTLTTQAFNQAQKELASINAVTIAALSASQQAIAQAQTNAVESSNMISKQAIAHRDIAIDHEWNVDEQAVAATIVSKILSEMAKSGSE